MPSGQDDLGYELARGRIDPHEGSGDGEFVGPSGSRLQCPREAFGMICRDRRRELHDDGIWAVVVDDDEQLLSFGCEDRARSDNE
jgi:hypothetical protein